MSLILIAKPGEQPHVRPRFRTELERYLRNLEKPGAVEKIKSFA
jgi:hypothetical protein